jgi:hypothetical protein
MLPKRIQLLVDAAQAEADARPDFLAIKGPGAGDRSSAAFVAALRAKAKALLGSDLAEYPVLRETAVRVDYWFPEEETILEVALSLRNPLSEFERDVLKAVIARAEGLRVTHLVVVAKQDARTRIGSPWYRKVVDWAQSQGIEVTFHELHANAAT